MSREGDSNRGGGGPGAEVSSRGDTCLVGSVRDDGAGTCPKSDSLMAHGDRIRDLVDELEEIVHKCSNSEMERILDVVNETLHKATSLSRISISLGCMQQVCKVPEYYASVVGMRKGAPAAASAGSGSNSQPKKKRPAGGGPGGTPKGSSGGGTVLSASPGSPPKGARKEKWPDVAGAKGPNGLERKVGGNPAGEPCSKHGTPGGCPFQTCSYKH